MGRAAHFGTLKSCYWVLSVLISLVPLSAAAFSPQIHLAVGATYERIKLPTERVARGDLTLTRARVWLPSAPDPATYRTQLGFSADHQELTLLDAWGEVTLGPQGPRLRAGWMKRPMGREFLTPAHDLTFTERSLLNQVFATDRDLGLALQTPSHWGFDGSLGAFRGVLRSPVEAGRILRREVEPGPTSPPVRVRPAIALRLSRRPPNSGVEGALRWSVGLSTLFFMPSAGQADSAFQSSVDLHLTQGSFSLLGEFFVASGQEGGSMLDHRFEGAGYVVQSALSVSPAVEPALRFTHLFFGEVSTDIKELALALNWRPSSEAFRLVAGASVLKRMIPGGYRSDIKATLTAHWLSGAPSKP